VLAAGTSRTFERAALFVYAEEMTVEPMYPAVLRAAIDEAAHEAAGWAEAEEHPPDREEYFVDDRYIAFITGRAGEIELVADEVVEDWQRGTLTAAEAARQLREFIKGIVDASYLALLVARRHPAPRAEQPDPAERAASAVRLVRRGK
jgi:hypothetical protein